MSVARFKRLILGTGLTGTDNGDDTITIDASGGGGAPSGAAGGALDGTYPNPGIAASVAGAGLSEASDVLGVNVDSATIEIASDTLRVKAGGIGATELASTAVTPGTYGDATHSPQLTVDADGRLTAASNVAISGGGGGGATVLAYVEFTSPVSITANADSIADLIVSAGAVIVPGSQVVCIEFGCPSLILPSPAGGTMVLNLYQGSSDIGRLLSASHEAANAMRQPVYLRHYFTPAAGTYTWSVRGWGTTNDGLVLASAGGASTYMPGFIRVTTGT